MEYTLCIKYPLEDEAGFQKAHSSFLKHTSYCGCYSLATEINLILDSIHLPKIQLFTLFFYYYFHKILSYLETHLKHFEVMSCGVALS